MCVPSCEIFLKSKTTLHATVLRPLRPRVQWTLLPCRAVRTEHEPLSISMDERNQPLNILFRSPWLVAAALSSAVVQLLSQPMQLRCWSSISVETPSTIRETKKPQILLLLCFPQSCFYCFIFFLSSFFFAGHRTDNQRWVVALSLFIINSKETIVFSNPIRLMTQDFVVGGGRWAAVNCEFRGCDMIFSSSSETSCVCVLNCASS